MKTSHQLVIAFILMFFVFAFLGCSKSKDEAIDQQKVELKSDKA